MMRKLWNLMRRIRSAEEGQSLVEYGLIIALIAVVVIGALLLIGGHLSSLFGGISNQLNTTNG